MRAVLLLFVLFTGAAQAQQPDPDQLLKTAIDAQQRGDFDAAILDYKKVLELRPNTVEAKVNLGAALAHVGQFDAAIEMYLSALPAVQPKTGVLLNLALAYYKKGDFQNARLHLEALHDARPKDVRVAILLGDTDVHLAKADDAVALLDPMESANSSNMDFEYVFGTALIAAGRRADGVTRIEKAAESGKSADAYLLAGVTLLQLNDFASARRDLEAALRLNPKLPNIYTLTGTAQDKTGDPQAAEMSFREALKINPDDFEANLYLGAILYKRRELTEARPYLEWAVHLDPKNSMARYESAMLKSKLGEYEVAADELAKVAKDDPQWLEPHVELASLYYKLHRAEDGARERQIVEKLTAEQQAQGPGKP
jgi:tetratricopeptide (TPR) repeat protein